jgi:hypothetical protein
MKHLWTLAKIVGIALTIAYMVVSWVEAEREIRVLCSMFEPGQPLDHVIATLHTGEYLRYQTGTAGEAEQVKVSSYYNGLHTACTVTLDGEHVTERTYRTRAQAYVLFGE